MWVARDKNGYLYLYKCKPTKGHSNWITSCSSYIQLDPDLFPNVKFEDNEPTKIKLIKDEDNEQ